MIFYGLSNIPYAIDSLKMANLSLSWFSLFWGRELAVAIYNTIIYSSYINYRNYKKKIQLNESFLIFFVIFVMNRYAMMIAG